MAVKVVRFDEERFLTAMKRTRLDFDAFDAIMDWPDQVAQSIRATQQFLQHGVSQRMDAGESAFFARQLEYVKAKTYDVKYPEYPAMRLLPVSSEAGPGAKTITFRQYNVTGEWKLIADNGRDLPRVDTYGKEFHRGIKSYAASYGYTLQEVRSAMFGNIPLEQRKANAARLTYEQKVNKIAWFADGTATYAGMYGLFYAPSATHSTVPNGSWCDSSGNPGAATPDQIIADVNQAINYPRTLTKKVEEVNQVLIPVPHYSYISTTPRSGVSDTTILQFLKSNHPGVSFDALNECLGATKPSTGTGTTNLLIAYRRDPDALTLEIPQPFEQLPIQEVGLEYQIPCHMRIAGVMTYYPLAINIAEGI
jgi:hypothetical protein